MQTFRIKKGSTSVILPISIYDSSSTTGGKLTGLVYNSSGLTAYYNRTGAAGSATAISLVSATKGTYTSGGFVAIDATNMPGDYELHIPNAALASGANSVLVQLKGATNMVPKNVLIELVAVDDQDSVRMGLTALPNADAAANGGLPTVDSNNAVKLQSGTAANQISLSSGAVLLQPTQTGVTIPTVTSVTNNVNAVLANAAHGGASATAQFGGSGGITSNITGDVTGSVGSVSGAVGSVTGSVGSVTAAVTVGTNNDKTGYALSSAGVQSIWDVLTSALVTAGSVGKRIVDYLDVAVSSRSTYAGGDTAGTTTLLSRVVGTIASGTHQPQSGDSYALANGASGFVAIKGDTAAILYDTGTSGVILPQAQADKVWNTTVRVLTANTNLNDPTAAEIADAVWDEASTGHTDAGKAGAQMWTDIDAIAVDVAGLDGAAMRGTDGAALASVCTEARLAELDASNLPADVAAVKSDTAAILADTGTDGVVVAAGSKTGYALTAEYDSAKTAASAADVNEQVLDVLNVDTFAEPAQGAPPATATLVQKIGYLFKAWRNKTEQTSSQYSLYNDDASTVDHKATFTDDGTTATRGEIASGP